MLVIRKAQIQKFIAADAGELTEVVREALRLAVADRVADYADDELGTMVKIGIERAQANGLTGAEDIAAFVAVMFEVAPRFDEQPEIRQVLDDERFAPADRLNRAFQSVDDAAWLQAGKRYDDSFWFPEAPKNQS